MHNNMQDECCCHNNRNLDERGPTFKWTHNIYNSGTSLWLFIDNGCYATVAMEMNLVVVKPWYWELGGKVFDFLL